MLTTLKQSIYGIATLDKRLKNVLEHLKGMVDLRGKGI
jgi:hypothetical protein